MIPDRLLGIWPHPDDEAYLSAGLMGRMADAGNAVTMLTVTRGEKGTSDPADHDQPHFARRREGELRAALATLGVTDLRFLGHRDGECDLVDPEEAIAAVVSVIEAVRPEVLVTFGPDGITGHPDHRVVSSWVTEAWRRVGGQEVCDLLYSTMSEDFVEEFATLHDRLGAFTEFGLDGPVSTPDADIVMSVRLDEHELDRKRRVLACHASQTEGIAAAMGEPTFRSWWRTEYFRRPTPLEVASSWIVARRPALAGR